ncbi:MAG: hypothetical protein ACREXP_29965, partial [Steroidobacteraceae bacterium]
MILCDAQHTQQTWQIGFDLTLKAPGAALLLLSLAASAPAFADRQQDPQLGKLLEQALAAGACFEDKFDEQVWFAAMEPKLKPLLKNAKERQELLHHVHCEARRLR